MCLCLHKVQQAFYLILHDALKCFVTAVMVVIVVMVELSCNGFLYTTSNTANSDTLY